MARGPIVALALMALASSVGAETAWVKDELRLNVRSGGGTQYRIKGSIGTGDRVEILNRGDGWTHVRTEELGEGWIPEGFLQAEPPAAIRLTRLLEETSESRERIDSLASRAETLQQENATFAEQDAAQKEEIELLTRENLELKAGARWPEWITGAGILGAGMAMGAILRSVTGRRQRPRIRL